MENFIQITKENISKEHICCSFSDKKCTEGYQLKKEWLKNDLQNGYVFYRLNERAKVFIEYGPSEFAWTPVDAQNYLFINCFWVSGKYKKNGYGKALLHKALDDAKHQNKDGLITIVGAKKFHFMSETKWFLKQGFEIADSTDDGFILLVRKTSENAEIPSFKEVVKRPKVSKDGIVVYYSNRCPFTEYYVKDVLKETVKTRNLKLEINKIETMEQAQASPTPATIFSLFYNGKFITTDLSICLKKKFDKIIV